MIAEGFELMAVGMTTVFAFLILMVGCMKLMGKYSGTLERIFPADEEPPATPSAAVAAAVGATAVVTSATAGSPRDKVAIALAAAHRARG